jgi:hypothetical protein
MKGLEVCFYMTDLGLFSKTCCNARDKGKQAGNVNMYPKKEGFWMIFDFPLLDFSVSLVPNDPDFEKIEL